MCLNQVPSAAATVRKFWSTSRYYTDQIGVNFSPPPHKFLRISDRLRTLHVYLNEYAHICMHGRKTIEMYFACIPSASARDTHFNFGCLQKKNCIPSASATREHPLFIFFKNKIAHKSIMEQKKGCSQVADSFFNFFFYSCYGTCIPSASANKEHPTSLWLLAPKNKIRKKKIVKKPWAPWRNKKVK